MADESIRTDFDRIARVAHEGWDHNSHYHRTLLAELPPRLGAALDIGCGTGAFTRLLAQRTDHVLGLDLSPGMIEQAWIRSAGYPNIDYQVVDVNEWQFPAEGFDCVASIAAFHHLPLAQTLARIRRALRPGGTLVALDLYQLRGPGDMLLGLASLPVSLALKLLRTGRLREPAEARAAWAAHAPHDAYLTMAEVLRVCAAVLPGAELRQLLLLRYSLVWRKPLSELNAPDSEASAFPR
ncbi:MAG: class I SAM-dependent methyltransferase [Anaerolineales bacterium]|nr:class I SAM-dependent methyltransferase [Anaerolineales bacterium]